jgi:hypothetical protein
MRVKIGNTGYVKDLTTGGIFCTDLTVQAKYEAEIGRIKADKARDLEINNLKSEISEIKHMLAQLLNRGQHG